MNSYDAERWEAAKHGVLMPPRGLFDDEPPIDVYEHMARAVEYVEEVRKHDPTAVDHTSDMRTAMARAFKAIQDRLANGNKLAGIPTGYGDIDRRLDGLQAGRLYVIGGRPGAGKSTLGTNLALRLAGQGAAVHHATLEMPTDEQALRCLFCFAGVDEYRWKQNSLQKEHWTKLGTAVNALKDYPIRWDESTGLTIQDLRGKVETSVEWFRASGQKLSAILVDHAGKLRSTTGRDFRVQMVEVTNGLKVMAAQLEIAVVALVQLKRLPDEHKSRPPVMSDLKETGTWEEDADAVLLLHRPDCNRPRAEWDQKMRVILPKVRNGEPGECEMRFIGSQYRIVSEEPERDYAPHPSEVDP